MPVTVVTIRCLCNFADQMKGTFVGQINVTILAPNRTVHSMVDEIEDGKVESAAAACRATYSRYATNGDVKVVEYGDDFEAAVLKALDIADETEGNDLLILVTDFVGNGSRVSDLLAARLADDCLVIVPVSNQGYDEEFADELDNDHVKANQIDVVKPEDLSDEVIPHAEVAAWAGV